MILRVIYGENVRWSYDGFFIRNGIVSMWFSYVPLLLLLLLFGFSLVVVALLKFGF